MMTKKDVKRYAESLGWEGIDTYVLGVMFDEIINKDGGDDEKAKEIVRKWYKASVERGDKLKEYAKNAYFDSDAYMRDLKIGLFGCDEAKQIEEENGKNSDWVERYR